MTLDSRLSFKQHVERTTAKAARVATTLARLMPNIGGPRQGMRKLLPSVVTSVLTYGIAIWDDVLKNEKYRRKVAAVHRLSALRVSCAFRTESDDAVRVIAEMMAVEILAVERKQLYEQQSTTPKDQNELKRTLRHLWRTASNGGRKSGMRLEKEDGHIA